MPAWLARRAENKDEQLYVKRSSRNPEMARFILESLFKRMDSALDRVAPVAKKSVWSGYQTANNYTETASSAKERFVAEVLKELRPRRVLDVGCNTGHFSRLAARAGASVVAIDYDPVVVGAVWKQARAEKLPILPLVVNLARPSPATGWLNSECPSFLERAAGHFDCVLMLAVIHHMLVSERIPLDAILAAAASLTSGYAVIEFIEPGDSMFRRLLRGRAELHEDLTAEMFENACRGRFDIVRREPVEGSQRWLYLLRRRTG
jgi:SAM-dependent methyltransferase